MTDRNRRRETGIVALYLGYLPRPLEPFPTLVINGLISRLASYRKHLLIHEHFENETDESLFDDLMNGAAEGLIFIPPARQLTERLARSGLPLVAIADRAPGIPSVVVENEMGAFMLAEHLSIRGYSRVMYRKDPYPHESAIKRFTAFSNAARFLGIELIETLPADPSGKISPEEEALLLAPAGQRPKAVVSWVDSYAHPALRFCKQHGLNVPKDIAIAGFDGIQFPVEPARRLTTIQAPWLRVAEKAVDLLIQILRGESVPQENVLPVDLVIGDTT